MSDRLQGKVTLISGAARGMGAATARLFVAEGADVLLTDVMDDEGEALAEELGEHAAYCHLDVTSEASWQTAIGFADATFGAVNVLVNNAGVLRAIPMPAMSLE